jgi:hypothetical protein
MILPSGETASDVMWSGDFPRQIMGRSKTRRIKPVLRTLNTVLSFTVILDFPCGHPRYKKE